METDADEVLAALAAQIRSHIAAAWPDAHILIEEDGVIPEDVPKDGFINVLSGDPGEPDSVLGGFQPSYYQHNFEIDIVVCAADSAVRRERYRKLVGMTGAALAGDETLGGLAIGMQYGEPRAVNERIEGAEDMKAATLSVLIDYRTKLKIPYTEGETEE